MLVAEKRAPKKESNFIGIYTVILAFIVIVALYFYIDNKTGSVEKEVVEPLIERDLEPLTLPANVDQSEAVNTQEKIVEVVDESEVIKQVETTAIEKEAEVVPSVLNESDPYVLTLPLSSSPYYLKLLFKMDIIQNFVVFTDNFSRGDLVPQFSPFAKPDEHFSVLEKDKKIQLNEQSYHRYDRYVDIINAMDMDFVSQEYLRLKPLFTQAYQEIGYPDKSFDIALYDAIALAADTPVLRQPITLVAPSAMYKFADPALESLPDAQKLMLRMGPDNIVKLNQKLQQFKDALQKLEP